MYKYILLLLTTALLATTACNQKPSGRRLAGSSQTADEAQLALEEEGLDPEAEPTRSVRDEEEVTEKPARKKSTITKKSGTWRMVSKLTGSKNRKSKPFRINGEEWKIKWKTRPGKGEFIIILHDRNSDFTEIITTTDEAESNFQSMRDGGEYYLQIESARPYEILVEEYR